MKFFPSFSLLSPDSQALREFLAYLPSVNTDLSTISAPTPLLLPKSVVEYPAMVALHHKLFLLPTTQPSPIDRAVSIFKNYVCTLRAQANAGHLGELEEQASGNQAIQPLKKPLNSFLGELLVAWVKDKESDSETRVICEQVSHHPPVTASYVSNPKRGISIQAYLGQLTNFTPRIGGITITQNGHALTHLEHYDEYHLTTFPTLRIKNLLGLGGSNRHLEYSGTAWIVSSSGLITKIVFEEDATGGSLKGAFGFRSMTNEDRNSKKRVTATISSWHKTADGEHEVDEKPLVRMSGSWDGRLEIEYINSGKEETFEVSQFPEAEIHTPPKEKQTEWYSQKAWSATKSALAKGDWKTAAEEKRKIEEWQRGLRRKEEAEGIKWKPKYFRSGGSCEVAEDLAKVPGPALSHLGLATPVWRFTQSHRETVSATTRKEV